MAEILGQHYPDNLIGGDKKLVTEEVTIQSGEVLVRGTVLGRVTISVPATGTADGGNTGDGTMTGVSGRRYTRAGVYTMECVTAQANAGIFSVLAPDGTVLPQATVGVAYVEDALAFTINDGATDFVVGDKFTVTVAVGSRECKIVKSGAADGSQNPYAVLAEDVDASAAEVRSIGYLEGQFNERRLVFDGTDTIETFRDAMRDLGMIAVASQPAGLLDQNRPSLG